MLEEKFGRPEIEIPELKENTAAINEAELSQEKRDRLIEEAEERLRFLMDRARATATLAKHNRFISKSGYKRLLEFLERVSGEIAASDENSADINETLARLNSIADRLKLPGDIEEENVKTLLERMEEAGKSGKQNASSETGAMSGAKKESFDKARTVKGHYLRRINRTNQRENRRQS